MRSVQRADELLHARLDLANVTGEKQEAEKRSRVRPADVNSAARYLCLIICVENTDAYSTPPQAEVPMPMMSKPEKKTSSLKKARRAAAGAATKMQMNEQVTAGGGS